MTVLQYVVHARARARSASFFFRPAVKKSRLECLSLVGHWLPTCGAAGGYKLALRRGLLRRECLQTAFLSSWWAVCPRPGCRYFLWRLPHRAVDQHHYAVLLDPIPVRLRQGTQIPIVCCNDNRHPPQKHAVRVKLRSTLAQDRPIDVSLQHLFVLHEELWGTHLIKQNCFVFVSAKCTQVWVSSMLNINNQSVWVQGACETRFSCPRRAIEH